MQSISLEPGCYRLRIRGDSDVVAAEIVDVDDAERSCRLDLADNDIRYFLELRKPLVRGRIRFIGKNSKPSLGKVDFVGTSRFSYLARRACAAAKRFGLQSFGAGEKLLGVGARKQSLAAADLANAEFRFLRLCNLDDASVDANQWPWIDEGWPRQDCYRPVHGPSLLSVCIYVHVHYVDTWPEIRSILLRDGDGADLIFTLTTESARLELDIKTSFPRARIFMLENRGRDVGPFVALLVSGIFDEYDVVCKIHGKLSRKNGQQTKLGHRVRRYSLACLVASGARDAAVRLFDTEPTLGLVGPANLLLPPSGHSPMRYIKSELEVMRALFERLEVEFTPEETQFFAGTMFWFRPAAFAVLRSSGITIADFDSENGAKRNTLHHALERTFGVLPKVAGFQIGRLQPQSATEGQS